MLGAPLSGTVTPNNSAFTAVGTGTHFTTDLSGYATCPGPPSSAQIIPVMVAWNGYDGAGSGRYGQGVYCVTTDTLFSFQFQWAGALGSGLTLYQFAPNTSTYNNAWWGMNAGAGGNSWMYYDFALSLYRLYYRTGLQAYLTAADQWADYWWQWAINQQGTGVTGDSGSYGNVSAPRALAMQSAYIRAHRLYVSTGGSTNRFAGLYNTAGHCAAILLSGKVLSSIGGDSRENGYCEQDLAWVALADPNSSDVTQACTWIHQSMTNTYSWPTWQISNGSFPEQQWQGGEGYVTLGLGTAPWRMALAVLGLETAYSALAGPCSNPTDALTLLSVIDRAVNYIYFYGLDQGNFGEWYETQYQNDPLTTTSGNGTVSIMLNSTTLTGVGTNFLSTLCGTPANPYVGFVNSLTVYVVSSCASDTQATLMTAFGSNGEASSLSASAYAFSQPGYAGCRSMASYCGGPEGGSVGVLSLDRTIPESFSWCALNGCTTQPSSTYLYWAEIYFTYAYGGPADGPNGVLPCASKLPVPCSNTVGDWAVDVTTGNNAFYNLAKNFDEGNGTPSGDVFLGDVRQAGSVVTGSGTPALVTTPLTINPRGIVVH